MDPDYADDILDRERARTEWQAELAERRRRERELEEAAERLREQVKGRR